MIRTRLLAVAFLINDNRLLLMKRSPRAKLFPGRWAPIGGHLEADEMNNPRAACLREIHEETGLTDNHLVDLSLRYIVHRRRAYEIRTQYMYFGFTNEDRVGQTDEGELHWVPFDQIMDLDVSATTRFALEYYTQVGSQTACVYVGTVDARDGKPVINWGVLRDWE
ncbi:MAG: NUDIX domain-containing protein [Anaerolineae bacterium]|nr:NUDIX domain-containing protein [Anaerolineae bacterium]